MPISSSQYTIYLANSNLGGGFTLVFTWSPEKKRNSARSSLNQRTVENRLCN